MASHEPTAAVECDVFVDPGSIDIDDPVAVAVEAWESIQRWVHSGYKPVVTVTMPGGERHDVDLEEHDG